MIRIFLFLLLVVTPASANDWPDDLAREGDCAVCSLRGGEHGTERYVDWRDYQGERYGFCSKDCAEAFDQMPAGYATPVLPRQAPDFRWSALDGSEIVPGKKPALLVDFWATWCAPCLAAIPELEELYREFAESGLQVVGVSIDEKREALDSYLERRPVSYPVVHDGGDDPAWWQFRVPAIPAAFLLNEQGQIVAQWNGQVDTEVLRAEIDALVGRDQE